MRDAGGEREKAGAGEQGLLADAVIHNRIARAMATDVQDFVGGEARAVDWLAQQRQGQRVFAGERLFGLEPMALGLIRIRGDFDALAGQAAVGARPVDRRARHVQVGDRLQKRAPRILARAHAGHPTQRVVFEEAARQTEQVRRGTDLDHSVATFGGERLHAVVKAHRLAHVAHPIIGCGQAASVAVHTARFEGRNKPNARRMERDRLGDLAERVEHWLHQRRVEGARHVEAFKALAGGFKLDGELLDRIGWTGDRQTRVAVVRGDGEVA